MIDFNSFIGRTVLIVVRQNGLNKSFAYTGRIIAVDTDLQMLQFCDKFENKMVFRFEAIEQIEQTNQKRRDDF